jgi:WD40 repeat protein
MEKPSLPRPPRLLALLAAGALSFGNGGLQAAPPPAGDTWVQHLALRKDLANGTEWVFALALSGNGSLLAAAGRDRTIHLWNLDSDIGLSATDFTHVGSIYTLAISPDGNTLASGSLDTNIKLWNLAKTTPLRTLRSATKAPVTAVRFSPDGRRLVASNQDGRLSVWNTANWSVRRIDNSRARSTYALAAATRRFATGDADGKIRIWAYDRSVVVAGPIAAHPGPIFALAYSPDQKTLASAGDDRTIRLWTLRTGREALRLASPSPATSLAYSPDGQILLSTHTDGRIRFWSLTDGRPIHELSAHSGPVWAAALAPAKRAMVSAGSDGAVKLWQSP